MYEEYNMLRDPQFAYARRFFPGGENSKLERIERLNEMVRILNPAYFVAHSEGKPGFWELWRVDGSVDRGVAWRDYIFMDPVTGDPIEITPDHVDQMIYVNGNLIPEDKRAPAIAKMRARWSGQREEAMEKKAEEIGEQLKEVIEAPERIHVDMGKRGRGRPRKEG